jgi:transposase
LARGKEVGVHLDGSCNGSVSRLEVIEGPSGRRQRTEAERARIAAESLMPGMRVADIARKHGTTRWQIYNWRNKLRAGQLMVPESLASLPMFAELMVESDTAPVPPTRALSAVEIVVGDIVIRAHVGADEGQLTRAIRAARAAMS